MLLVEAAVVEAAVVVNSPSDGKDAFRVKAGLSQHHANIVYM